MLLKAFAWQSNIVQLGNKGIDPVHHRLYFLDKPGEMDPCTISGWYAEAVNLSSSLLYNNCLLLNLFCQADTQLVYLADTVISASMCFPTCRYPDRKLALFIEFKDQNSSRCSQSSMKKLLCIIGWGWVLDFEEALGISQLRLSWQASFLFFVFNIQFTVWDHKEIMFFLLLWIILYFHHILVPSGPAFCYSTH